jgi:hypothetical protein
METPIQSVTVETKTRTSTLTKYAYGLVGAFAIFGFANFWDQLSLFNEDIAAAQPVTRAVASTPTVSQLTMKLFTPKASAEELASIATQRQSALIALAGTNPAKAQAAILAGPALEQLPSAIQAQLEHEVTLDGTLELMHYDIDVEQNLTRDELFLVSGKSRMRIFVPNPKDFEELAEANVKVHGFKIDDQHLIISAADLGTTAVTTTATTVVAAPATTRKAAVIMFNFVNDTRQPVTAAQMRSVVFADTGSVNSYDQEVSFGQFGVAGKVDPTGDVFGWITLPDIYNSSTQPCSGTYAPGTGTWYYRIWSDAAKQMLIDAGNDMTGYQNFIYTFPNPGGCPGAGWAGVNSSDSWVMSNSLRVVTHEHGHNLGAYHASTYSCTDGAGVRVTIGARVNCTLSEYGDPFDVMGSPVYHFSNAHKNETKILPAANIRDVTTDGDYDLYPIEQSSTGALALRLPRDVTSTGVVSEHYWLEYRRPFGFDNFSLTNPVVNGVSVRLARASSGYISANTLLLDTTPTTTSFTDAPLAVGQIFDDTVYGWRFQTIAAGADKATVRITKITSTCGTAVPTVNLIPPSSTYASNGQKLPYNLSVTNSDSSACPPSTFTVTPTLPAELSQAPSPISYTLSPGASTTTTINVSSSLTAPIGAYTFTETVTNTTSGLSTSTGSVYNVTGPDLSGPTITLTPANGTTVKGKNIKISATANDGLGVGSIVIGVDGVTKQTCTNTTSCAYTWNTTGYTTGNHTIFATATDTAGNVSTVTNTVKK